MRGSRGQFRVEAVSGQWWAVHVPSGAAPGYRERANGASNNIGGNGHVWTSTTNQSFGGYLHIYLTELYSANTAYRAYGFLLRCLSE